MDVAIGALSAVVAAIAASVSVVFARRSHGLQQQAVRDAYLERVRDWADDTIEITTAILRLCRDGCRSHEFDGTRDTLRTALSAQIEKGRWFFPNVLQERVGQRKEAAYRGLRQPILDALIAVYDAVDGVDWDNRLERRNAVLSAQRAFVSEVQARLDPNLRDETYKILTDRYRAFEEYVDEWPSSN